MATVIPYPGGEDIGHLLNRFKRACSNERLGAAISRHNYYLSPGERRRKKASAARARLRKSLQRLES